MYSVNGKKNETMLRKLSMVAWVGQNWKVTQDGLRKNGPAVERKGHPEQPPIIIYTRIDEIGRLWNGDEQWD